MQLKQFTVTGLFGSLSHKVIFPIPTEEGAHPSVIILHGRNGIGKTTLLRMLDGIIRLDFDTFRSVPFSSCSLDFTEGDPISVKSVGKQQLKSLEVTFGDSKVQLHPDHSGALLDKDRPAVHRFRDAFFSATSAITFEFIDTERLYRLHPWVEAPDEGMHMHMPPQRRTLTFRGAPNPKAKPQRQERSLALRVASFIREAQVNYRRFFSTTEPDLFPRIIERLTMKEEESFSPATLKADLTKIHEQDQATERLGLESDYWDYDQLINQLSLLSRSRSAGRVQALTVLGSYVELLQSRAAERALVADRLFTFENLVSNFLTDKRISIDPGNGFKILTEKGNTLEEHQLSSGEFHLLFLMVAALVTRRRGTVIAIDEPEMSMHIAWQRKLVPALVECASGAEPLFIFATHSPDLATSFPEAMIELR